MKNTQHEILAQALYEAARSWANASLLEFQKSHPARYAECAPAIAEGRLPFHVTIESAPPRVVMRLVDPREDRATTIAIYGWGKWEPIKRENFN